jgi:tight adherence protein B
VTTLVLPGMLICGVVAIVLVFLASAGERRLARRARRIAAAKLGSPAERGPQLRVGKPGELDVFLVRFLPRPALLRQRLAASGLKLTISAYLLISLGLAVSIGVFAAVKGAPLLIATLVGSVAGLLLPHLALGYMVERRRKKFAKLFPDALGLMIRGLKAGLPALESIMIVGREAAEPVGGEYRRISDQVRMGQGIEESLWAAARRINLAEFNFLAITIAIQRETGGNLAETLENLDEMIRKRHQMKLKIKAMSSEATATAMIIGSMPFAMGTLLFFVSRPYIMTLFNNFMGNVLMAVGLCWMSIGFFVMSQMIRFEV